MLHAKGMLARVATVYHRAHAVGTVGTARNLSPCGAWVGLVVRTSHLVVLYNLDDARKTKARKTKAVINKVVPRNNC